MTIATPALDVSLVTLATSDGWPVDVLHTVPRTLESVPVRNRTAFVHVHGKGGSMYRGTGRFLPALLPGVEHLSLNMRCHDLANYGPAGTPGGGMYEDLENGWRDLAAAVDHLRIRGVGRIVLVGHSSGGWYVGEYASHRQDVDARVLLSPLTDNKTRVAWWFPGGEGLDSKRAEAEAHVAAGTPEQLVLLPGDYWAASSRAFLERISEPDETWISAVELDDTPSLLAWGTAEDRDPLWRELATRIPGDAFTAAIADADHDYTGDEEELARVLTAWTTRVWDLDCSAGTLDAPVTDLQRP